VVERSLAFAGFLLAILAVVVPPIAAEDVVIPSLEAGKQLQSQPPGTESHL
jgi:hypothetical protein